MNHILQSIGYVDLNFVAALCKISWLTQTDRPEHSCRAQTNEPVHEISNNVLCATIKASDQPAHTRILIRAFASRLSIL